ncbi:hypothetical protein FQN57_005228 [Myotisia sp. PD_48]|nr:hypothetical protein FQN57_005228 [Myotisia sp. PD_48]
MYRTPTQNVVPSRAALRILRRLALAGTTAGAIGSVCTVATLTYEVNRRVQVAEHMVEQKRNLESLCPNYSATGGGAAVERMMEAAEAGQFFGLDSMKPKPVPSRNPSQNTDTLRPSYSDDLTYKQFSPRNSELIRPNNNSFAPPLSQIARQICTDNVSDPKRVEQQDVQVQEKQTEYLTWESKIQSLLEQDKPVQAAQHFSRPDIYIPDDAAETVKSLSSKIFHANLKARHTSVAVGIFNWIEKNAEVTQNTWEALLTSLGSVKRSPESLSILYLRYADRFELPSTLNDIILRALIDSYRLGEAKTFIFDNVKNDSTCSLSAIYLEGLFSKTQNADLVETQMKKLISSLLEHQIPLMGKLFDPLLKSYVESGSDEKAQQLVTEIKSVHGLEPGMRALGLLAFGKALKTDWRGVEDSLQEIHDLGLTKSEPRNFAKVFDRIFLEYFLGNTGESIRNFVFDAIEKYELEMDDILFEHVITAFIQKGTSAMVNELVSLAKEKKWKLRFNEARFLQLLRDQRLSCEKNATGLWQMFRASQTKYGRAGASRRVLNWDKDEFPLEEVYTMPWTGEPTKWSEKNSLLPSKGKKVDSFTSLRKRMIHCINVGRMGDAVDLFREAMTAGKVLKPIHIELAVVASMIQSGATTGAQAILENSSQEFQTSRVGRSYRQVFELRSTEKCIKFAVLKFYRILAENLLPVTHRMAFAGSSMMLQQGMVGATLRLFRAVNKCKHAAATPFDGPALVLITRTSWLGKNLKGVRWALITALHRSSAALNQDILVEVYRVIESLKSEVENPSKNPQYLANGWTPDSLSHDIEYLEHLVQLLETENAKLGNNNKKKKRRVSDKADTLSPLVSASPLQTESDLTATISNWEERTEFEKVCGKREKSPRPSYGEDAEADSKLLASFG